jgi:hypothetical protein
VLQAPAGSRAREDWERERERRGYCMRLYKQEQRTRSEGERERAEAAGSKRRTERDERRVWLGLDNEVCASRKCVYAGEPAAEGWRDLIHSR